MIKFKKSYFLVLLVFVLIVVLFQSQYQKENIVLKVGVFTGSNWDVPSTNSYEIFDDLISRFEKKYPNVKVEYTSGITKNEYTDYLSKQAIKGELPDVMLVLPEDFSTFAKIGILEELDSYVKNDTTFDKDVYYSASYEAGIYEEKLYGLPYESVPTLMFMNKTLLEEENIAIPEDDWTWTDFYEICQQVSKDKNHDGKLDQFGVYDYDWEEAIYANNVDLFKEEGKEANLDSENMIEAVEYVREIQQLNDNIIVSSSDFDEGKVAFCPMQFSTYRAYMPYPWRVKKYSSFEWDCITLPRAEDGENTSIIETLSVGMSAISKHKEYAWLFMKMLSCDEETQMDVFYKSQGVSVLKSVSNSEEAMNIIMEDNLGESTFKMDSLNEIMLNGISQPNFNQYFKVAEQIDIELYRIIHSTLNVESELALINHKINKILNE